MPRSGPGTYALPPNVPDQQPNTTIQSSWANSYSGDVEAAFNTEWPLTLLPTITIAKGGTGATTAVGAIDAISVKGADIASATTTNLATATGNFVHVTGTTTITGLGTATAGVTRKVTFDAALTLTHNGTSLILPGAANITTAAGDTAIFVSEGSGNWRCLNYKRAAADFVSAAVLEGSAVALTTATPANITSISLTAGDWDVFGTVAFAPAASTTISILIGWISVTSATSPGAPNEGAYYLGRLTFTTGAGQAMPVGQKRINLTSTTTVYLSAQASFAVSTMGAYGFIGARRVG